MAAFILCGRGEEDKEEGGEAHDGEEAVTRTVGAVGCCVERLLLTNAAGGLDATMRPGDIVVLHDHIDMVRFAGPMPADVTISLAPALGHITV